MIVHWRTEIFECVFDGVEIEFRRAWGSSLAWLFMRHFLPRVYALEVLARRERGKSGEVWMDEVYPVRSN